MRVVTAPSGGIDCSYMYLAGAPLEGLVCGVGEWVHIDTTINRVLYSGRYVSVQAAAYIELECWPFAVKVCKQSERDEENGT